LSAQLDPAQTSSDYSWTREVNGTFTNTFGETQLVDCKTVPRIPKKPPQ
jgi:hypothetical protein